MSGRIALANLTTYTPPVNLLGWSEAAHQASSSGEYEDSSWRPKQEKSLAFVIGEVVGPILNGLSRGVYRLFSPLPVLAQNINSFLTFPGAAAAEISVSTQRAVILQRGQETAVEVKMNSIQTNTKQFTEKLFLGLEAELAPLDEFCKGLMMIEALLAHLQAHKLSEEYVVQGNRIKVILPKIDSTTRKITRNWAVLENGFPYDGGIVEPQLPAWCDIRKLIASRGDSSFISLLPQSVLALNDLFKCPADSREAFYSKEVLEFVENTVRDFFKDTKMNFDSELFLIITQATSVDLVKEISHIGKMLTSIKEDSKQLMRNQNVYSFESDFPDYFHPKVIFRCFKDSGCTSWEFVLERHAANPFGYFIKAASALSDSAYPVLFSIEYDK